MKLCERNLIFVENAQMVEIKSELIVVPLKSSKGFGDVILALLRNERNKRFNALFFSRLKSHPSIYEMLNKKK